ncbi:VWA-like domain-containing protein [Sulfuricurvum sp.]|uniref:vWA domain-containing protein n=1 Tax=Sulfuricurvum sp. TaxID=2025608 RepID=UPI002616F2F9|nr:VWA-like domain-containing protein [Sulfuricurvum sp.]MDD2266402.1 VWA-like domain-containing protein [Sulfuricurvum sp.]MDD2782985.1 VWA-like domain-containing protein [Sulfuricurvum sp.]
MSSEQLLLKAKSLLTVKYPYFGMLASRLKHEPSDSVSGYASNGKRFIYNSDFLERRSVEEVMFILTNAVMHHVLSHQQRKLNRRGRLWQLATDYAINNLLAKNGLAIPQGANYNKEFEGMYAEEIYDALKEEYFGEGGDAFSESGDAAPQEAGMSQEADDSQGFANIDGISDEMDSQDESQWQYAASIAQEVAQRKGAMPLGLERLGKKVKPSDVDWRFELYNAVNRHMRNNYAFMPPNKKHIHRGIALPSLTSDTLSLCVAIDTSGSIDDALLGAFMEEFKTIMQNFPSVKIELIIADAKVHAHHTFQGGEKMDFRLKGGGGTDYRPTFDYVEANLPMTTMLLYFTDGEGSFPRIPPNYEVLWALSRKAKVPFGRGLVIFD